NGFFDTTNCQHELGSGRWVPQLLIPWESRFVALEDLKSRAVGMIREMNRSTPDHGLGTPWLGARRLTSTTVTEYRNSGTQLCHFLSHLAWLFCTLVVSHR
ncbi:MAG TPA: hypothetical protein PLN21_14270, partial [Gemmatales bacterium]|nr:hypothetical protein [Gemmatales bacterium]